MPSLYVHVPFCRGKCPYCDFYSLPAEEEAMDRYVRAVETALSTWKGEEKAKTVYFGGGTPNLLGAERLTRILNAAAGAFSLDPEVEVTVEVNPTHVDFPFFRDIRRGGFNRLSMGLQSADPEQLRFLGRRHTAGDVARGVEAAGKAGFDHISLDLMLGLPGEPKSNREKLRRSIAFAAGLSVEHISAYLLKVEENTPFAARGIQVPGDEEAAEEYLFAVEELEKRGYAQYEISNFAKPGWESRHNLVYWHGEEYLGFGPGAHSFYRGKRFYYPRDLEAFLRGEPPCPDGEGGSFPEYAMLNLRLTEGLSLDDCKARFGVEGENAFSRVFSRVSLCPPDLLTVTPTRISLTPRGFLVSNGVILRLLGEE